jgi:hypothetical protein
VRGAKLSRSLGGKSAQKRPRSRLTERALREHWNLSRDKRALLLARLYGIVESSDPRPREVIAAFKAILAAGKNNLESISTTMKAREHGEMEKQMSAIEKKLAERGTPSTNVPRAR